MKNNVRSISIKHWLATSITCALMAFGFAPTQSHAAQTSAGLTAPPVMTTRVALAQPFASSSIWNHPIGAGAVFVPANIPAVPGGDVWAPMPQMDDEIIVLKSGATLTNVYYSDAGWTGRDRCVATSSTVVAQVPVPSTLVFPNSKRNNSAVFLKPDGRTLLHIQPFTQCPGKPPTAMLKFAEVDLYGDGILGSHGGSRLSAIGGTLRIGELRPNTGAPRHALKVNVYAAQMLAKCSTKTQCYTWPAQTADSYATTRYGTASSTAPAAMKMGALLAIPTSRDLSKMGLETQPGKMLAWTLQNYGAYIVDDTYGAGFALNAENGADGSFRTQFKTDWGFDFEQRVRDNTPWVRDMQRIITALSVVSNNSAAAVGGGGRLLQAIAPELAAPSSVTSWQSLGIRK